MRNVGEGSPGGAGSGRRTLSYREGAAVAGIAAVVALLLLALGFWSGHRHATRGASFHDMRVNHARDLTALVDPRDPAVRKLAAQLGTPEAAYDHVRDKVRYEPMAPAGSPGHTIEKGAGSCLGKATLLCSLYRAMGVPASAVRVVTGDVVVRGSPADHAWLDLEYNDTCLQQDPSGLLGRFSFAEFAGTGFTRAFVMDENFCFNDEGLAVVSQLNRFRRAPAPEAGASP